MVFPQTPAQDKQSALFSPGDESKAQKKINNNQKLCNMCVARFQNAGC